MSNTTAQHWTERSVDDFVHKISTDFISQIQTKMESERMSRKELADALHVSMGRVSQVLNNPGNLTMRKVIEYSRTLGMKVAIVAYEDGDPQNQNGPINSEIFYQCWKNSGKPTDFFALSQYSMTLPFSKFSLAATAVLENYGAYTLSCPCVGYQFTGWQNSAVTSTSESGSIFSSTKDEITLSLDAVIQQKSATTQMMEVGA